MAELCPQSLDMAIDRAIIHIDTLSIGGIHELIAGLHMAWTVRQRLDEEKLGHRQWHFTTAPRTEVPIRVKHKVTSNERFFTRGLAIFRTVQAAQQGPYTFYQQAL